MLSTRRTAVTAARVAALTFLVVLAGLALITAPARATIVLLSTSSSTTPSSQDANLYDWQGQWTSALDRAAPLAGQLPAWQVNVGLYGDWYQPPNSNVVEQDPTCRITLQISGAPPIYTTLNPCVDGPNQSSLGGSSQSPVAESLAPDLAAAGNGPQTVTVTAYDALGGFTSSTSFNVLVDNTLPSPPNMSGAVGWQHGGKVVTSTAATNGPSGIAGESCSIASSTASWYPGATAQIAVTGNGTIPVRCTAENNAGVWGPTTEYDAMLDNSPPTGYFAPREPDNPTLASVITADSLSGVAGGKIQIQTANGWQGLATRYTATTGQLTATVPDDGSLPDGNYALRAIVTDAVGNTATITADQNDTPEIVTEPLRIVTQIDVGRSHALVKRCTVSRVRIPRRRQRHQRPASRLLRRCTQVAVPHASAIVKLRANQAAAVSGLVQTADGDPVAGAKVQIDRQASGWAQRPAGTLTANSRGRFTYTIPAGPSRTITFSFPGSPTLRASAAATTVQARGRVKITASRYPQAGGMLRISGRTLGGYVPAGGVLVQLQYRVRGLTIGWPPFHAPIRTNSHGRWSTMLSVPRTAAGYDYMVRALVSSQNGWPFLSTYSNVLTRLIS